MNGHHQLTFAESMTHERIVGHTHQMGKMIGLVVDQEAEVAEIGRRRISGLAERHQHGGVPLGRILAQEEKGHAVRRTRQTEISAMERHLHAFDEAVLGRRDH